MAIFLEQEYPLPPLSVIEQVSKSFEPKSIEVPLYPQVRQVRLVERRNENSTVQLIAVVGLLGLFALFGLFAYLRSTR